MADIQRIESLLNDAVGHAMDYARGDNSASNKHEAAWNEALTLIRVLTREQLTAASGEPVAWKVVANDGRLIGYTGSKAWAGQHLINEATITPLYAHPTPSAAGVTVTEDELDDMVDAAVESLAASAAKSFRDGHQFVPSPSDVRNAIGSALVALATRPTTPTPDEGASA